MEITKEEYKNAKSDLKFWRKREMQYDKEENILIEKENKREKFSDFMQERAYRLEYIDTIDAFVRLFNQAHKYAEKCQKIIDQYEKQL